MNKHESIDYESIKKQALFTKSFKSSKPTADAPIAIIILFPGLIIVFNGSAVNVIMTKQNKVTKMKQNVIC